MMIRKIFLIIAMFLPKKVKPYYYNIIFGWKVDSKSSIGFSYLNVGFCDIGPGCRIGALTVINGLDFLVLDDHSRIGNLNWISSHRLLSSDECKNTDFKDVDKSCLVLGTHSAITNRHYIDCSSLISVGAFTTVAGVRSVLLTHSIDVYRSVQDSKPIRIGKYCFVGTSNTILGGAVISDNIIIAAGSVVVGECLQSSSVYAGVPSKIVKVLDKDLAYFNRKIGVVK